MCRSDYLPVINPTKPEIRHNKPINPMKIVPNQRVSLRKKLSFSTTGRSTTLRIIF
jgi:hypothetical protein